MAVAVDTAFVLDGELARGQRPPDAGVVLDHLPDQRLAAAERLPRERPGLAQRLRLDFAHRCVAWPVGLAALDHQHEPLRRPPQLDEPGLEALRDVGAADVDPPVADRGMARL